MMILSITFELQSVMSSETSETAASTNTVHVTNAGLLEVPTSPQPNNINSEETDAAGHIPATLHSVCGMGTRMV